VADSIPAAEYEETLAKARGFLQALELQNQVGARELLAPRIARSNRSTSSARFTMYVFLNGELMPEDRRAFRFLIAPFCMGMGCLKRFRIFNGKTLPMGTTHRPI